MNANQVKASLRVIWQSTFKLIACFVILDLIAVCLHGLYSENILTSRFFNLSRDRGFAEIISYFKYVLIIYIFHFWNRQSPSQLIKAWKIFFIALLLDDMLGLHEAIGKLFLPYMNLSGYPAAHSKNFAEIFGFVIIEGSASILVACYFFQAHRFLQRYTVGLVLCLLPLIFSGILLDNFGPALIEQLGEMFAATLVLWYVHSKQRRINIAII